jgi:hypothetical protein
MAITRTTARPFIHNGMILPHLESARFKDVELPVAPPTPPNAPYTTEEIMRRSETIPAYEITIPKSEWHAIVEIYSAHWMAQNGNRAVRERWEQYRMMITLTE